MRGRLSRPRLALGIGILAAAGILAFLLLRGGDDSGGDGREPGSKVHATGRPEAATLDQLRDLGSAVGHPVYWAGQQPGRQATSSTVDPDGKVYVRDPAQGVPVGSRASSLTIRTYPYIDAFGALQAAAGRSGGITDRTPDGGLVVTFPTSPNNVHVAFPGSDYEIEVYDPRAGGALEWRPRARERLSGKRPVKPLTGSRRLVYSQRSQSLSRSDGFPKRDSGGLLQGWPIVGEKKPGTSVTRKTGPRPAKRSNSAFPIDPENGSAKRRFRSSPESVTSGGAVFGVLVANERAKLGLTQRDLAARIHTSPSTVARIEQGHPPSAEIMERLSVALSVELPGPLRRWNRYASRPACRNPCGNASRAPQSVRDALRVPQSVRTAPRVPQSVRTALRVPQSVRNALRVPRSSLALGSRVFWPILAALGVTMIALIAVSLSTSPKHPGLPPAACRRRLECAGCSGLNPPLSCASAKGGGCRGPKGRRAEARA